MILQTSNLWLNKVAMMTDFQAFPRAYQTVVEVCDLLDGQHEMRAWEYCMAFSAVTRWRQEQIEKATEFAKESLPALDIGGAGSKLNRALHHFGLSSMTVDPHGERGSRFIHRITAEEAAQSLAPVPVVTCISVIEHVEDHVSFADALARLVQPGGLLFLTADYHKDADSLAGIDDPWHFNWMRKRIYGPERWWWLHDHFRLNWGFKTFGEVCSWSFRQDWEDWEPTVYDYGFASMALVKETA